jgi:hypothetical protein
LEHDIAMSRDGNGGSVCVSADVEMQLDEVNKILGLMMQ